MTLVSGRWRERSRRHSAEICAGETIAVLGLTFRPNADDMREAPSIPLITALQDMGATVRAFDPVGMELARTEMPDVQYSADPYECACGADALVIVTEWEQFARLTSID
jgi:UDPglucose 6-dehydrogenase